MAVLRAVARLAAGGFALGAFAVAGVALLVAATPVSKSDVWDAERPPVVVVVDAEGRELAAYGRKRGRAVRLADLPAYAPNAFIAAEDRNFRHHWGFNPIALSRAAFVNLRADEIRQGGSTITQQLAKNLFLSSERSLERKLKELVYALWLESRFTKDEILTIYLNRVYFGGGAYGLDAAAWRWFRKPASELSLAEAATLAGLLKAPARYSPSSRPERAGARAADVLRAMADAGFVTKTEAEAAARQPLRLAGPENPLAPYAADYAYARARTLLGAAETDLVIETALDSRIQRAVDAAVAETLADPELGEDGLEAAAVVLSPFGAVLAMAGGRDYRASQFNRATSARRQPGSAFKTFVYVAALEAGYDPWTPVLDAPVRVGKWSPANYKGKYYGAVTLEEAYARSLNSAAVRLHQGAGRGRTEEVARRLGVSSPLARHAGLALGVSEVTPLELAGAYAPIANGGYAAEPYIVTAIRTPDGETLWRRPASEPRRVLAPGAARDMKHMMRAVVAYGSGRRAAVPGRDVGGKTGTTQDGRDGWFAGFAGTRAGVVWVGRDDGAPVSELSGSRAPAALWGRIAAVLDAPPVIEPAPRAPDPVFAIVPLDAAPPEDLDALLRSLEGGASQP